LAPHCSIRTLPSFSSVSHMPSGEFPDWAAVVAGAGAWFWIGADAGAVVATTGAGSGRMAGAASCCGAGALAEGCVEVMVSVVGATRAVAAAGSGEVFATAGAGSVWAGAASGACGSVFACCGVCLRGRSLSSPPGVVIDTGDRNRSTVRIDPNGSPAIFEGVLRLRGGAGQQECGDSKQLSHNDLLGGQNLKAPPCTSPVLQNVTYITLLV
jgi:hypothetical protein